MTATANTNTTSRRPQSLISTATRFAAAFAVAGIVSAACAAAAHESRHAVQESTAAIAGPAIYVTLPTVEIVARRQGSGTAAVAKSQSTDNAAQAL
jgi:hypothetical protein